MKRFLWILTLGFPCRAYGLAGLADDGTGYLVVVPAALLALCSLFATAFLIRTLLTFRRASVDSAHRRSPGISLWVASSFPLSAILGIVYSLVEGGGGWALPRLADPLHFISGLAIGALLSFVVLPAMLVVGALQIWCSRRRDRRLSSHGVWKWLTALLFLLLIGSNARWLYAANDLAVDLAYKGAAVYRYTNRVSALSKLSSHFLRGRPESEVAALLKELFPSEVVLTHDGSVGTNWVTLALDQQNLVRGVEDDQALRDWAKPASSR